MIRCAERLELMAVPGVPLVARGDDLGQLLLRALAGAQITLRDGDVLVVTSKIVSRAEGRFVDLARVEPSERARVLGGEIDKDPRFVELVLRESTHISRQARGVLVVRHRLGFIGANAGIDCSNAQPADAAPGSGPWALLLPEAPDATAAILQKTLEAHSGARVGVVISDSFGRPFRLGTVGAAIGCAGLPALWDRRGDHDIHGRVLVETVTALGDEVAAAAGIVAGQADEMRALVLVRGLSFDPPDEGNGGAGPLNRKPGEDLYA